ncbi:MAG TPA: response regulator [Acidobacteriota bacterium]|nr:response regulator [Acidobacteriota bacterium]
MAYKLIVADNSPAALETLRMAFIDSSYDVYTFTNGEEVIKSIPHIEPDAFVLGLSLKEKGGLEIGKYIRESEDYKDIPIVFLIGAYKELDMQNLSKIPNQGIFREPFDSEEVVRKLKSLIQGDNGLDTLPEEPAMDEIAELERKFQKRLDAIEKNMTGKMRNIVKKEIYEAIKEFEKRVKAAVLREIKDLDRANKNK